MRFIFFLNEKNKKLVLAPSVAPEAWGQVGSRCSRETFAGLCIAKEIIMKMS